MKPVFSVALAAVAAIASLGCGETEEVTNTAAPTSQATSTPSTPGPTAPAGTPSNSEYDDLTIVNLLGIPEGEQPSHSITVERIEKWDPGNPSFSRDGSKFWAPTEDGLAVGNPDRSVTQTIEGDLRGAVWGPDSTQLAVAMGAGPITINLMSADGVNQGEIAQTDLPLAMQFLQNGELFYVLGTELHTFDTGTQTDSLVSALEIDRTSDVPYLVSPDGQSIAILAGNSLSVIDRQSGTRAALSDSVQLRGASPVSWSNDSRLLIYSYITAARVPVIAVYDRAAGSQRDIIIGMERGTFAGMIMVPSGGWMVFAFYPAGSAIEVAAQYQAVNLYTGERSQLFERGLGLRPSADGRKITFARTDGLFPSDVGSWVATISF